MAHVGWSLVEGYEFPLVLLRPASFPFMFRLLLDL